MRWQVVDIRGSWNVIGLLAVFPSPGGVFHRPLVSARHWEDASTTDNPSNVVDSASARVKVLTVIESVSRGAVRRHTDTCL